MEPSQPEGARPADALVAKPERSRAPAVPPETLAGALPAWDLLPEAPVRRK
jgi:hypothetical protein